MAGVLWLSITEKVRAWKYRKDLNLFFEMLSPSKNDFILDIGAGTGWIASRVARNCDETYALEPKSDRVDFIIKKHPEVKAFSGTSQSIPFPENHFDKAYAIFSFHHFQDQADSLEEFHRIIKPRGMLLIQEFYPGKSRPIFEKEKITFLNPDELAALLGSHGFTKQNICKASRGYFILSQKSE